jgi:hypothetical protein
MTIKPSDMGATTQNWIGSSQYSADSYLSLLSRQLAGDLPVSVAASGFYPDLQATASIAQKARNELYLHIPFTDSIRITLDDAIPLHLDDDADPLLERRFAVALEQKDAGRSQSNRMGVKATLM